MSGALIFTILAPFERLFRPLQRSILDALGPALYPHGRELEAWSRDTQAFIEEVAPPQRLLIRFAVFFLELSPFLLQIGPRGSGLARAPFSRLPLDDQRRTLRRLDEHYSPALRNLWKLLRVVAHFIYFGERRRAQAYGFDPHERRIRADGFRRRQERSPTQRRRSHPPHERPLEAEAAPS